MPPAPRQCPDHLPGASRPRWRRRLPGSPRPAARSRRAAIPGQPPGEGGGAAAAEKQPRGCGGARPGGGALGARGKRARGGAGGGPREPDSGRRRGARASAASGSSVREERRPEWTAAARARGLRGPREPRGSRRPAAALTSRKDPSGRSSGFVPQNLPPGTAAPQNGASSTAVSYPQFRAPAPPPTRPPRRRPIRGGAWLREGCWEVWSLGSLSVATPRVNFLRISPLGTRALSQAAFRGPGLEPCPLLGRAGFRLCYTSRPVLREGTLVHRTLHCWATLQTSISSS